MKLLAIDPGDHTGWAYWRKESLKPSITGCINLSHRMGIDTQEKQLEYLWSQFAELVKYHEIDLCVIEGVKFFSGSVKSRTSAVRGNLMKLAYLIGGYCKICQEYSIEFKLVNPDSWKGQLPNSVIQERIKRILGEGYTNEHTICALGIGLFTMGEF